MDKRSFYAWRVFPFRIQYPLFGQLHKFVANFNDRCYDITTEDIPNYDRLKPVRAAEAYREYYACDVWVHILFFTVGVGAVLADKHACNKHNAIFYVQEASVIFMEHNKINMINKDEIETEAKTAQEAIKIALSKLGLKKTEVQISVLREENKGLFSMQGTKLAKVRVKKKS